MIAAGHRQADLPGYTLAQIRGYLKAIASQERDAARLALWTARAAHATNDDFAAALQALQALQALESPSQEND